MIQRQIYQIFIYIIRYEAPSRKRIYTVPRSIPNPIGIFLLPYLHLHGETAWRKPINCHLLNILSKYNFRPACFIQGGTVFRFFDTTSHAKTKLARLKAWLETNVNSLRGGNNLHQSPYPILIANKSLHEINKKLEEEINGRERYGLQRVRKSLWFHLSFSCAGWTLLRASN